MRLAKRLLVPAVMAGVLFTPGIASAHPVGTPGEPNCFGQRTSHANSPTHQGTPKERAAIFERDVLPFVPEAQELFGDSIEVREIQFFVRTNCSDNPIVPPPAP
jgi:hypothetical protein